VHLSIECVQRQEEENYQMRFNKRLGGVIGALVMLLAGAAVVYAAFSATGTGSGRASAATAQSITVNATACTYPGTSTGDMYPGGPPGAICFTLTNPNPYAVHFTTVQYLPVPTAITANSTNCPAGNVVVSSTATTAFIYTVSAGQTTGLLSIPSVLQMQPFAADNCQGASFNVPILLGGTQS
jgi:hypothetical protein